MSVLFISTRQYIYDIIKSLCQYYSVIENSLFMLNGVEENR